MCYSSNNQPEWAGAGAGAVLVEAREKLGSVQVGTMISDDSGDSNSSSSS